MRRVALAFLALPAIGSGLAACDALLGLGQYQFVTCSDCTDGGSDGASADATTDAFDAGPADGAVDSRSDADAADGGEDAELPSDAEFEASPVTLWARWRMPNPDNAPIAPGSTTLLPNPMNYQVVSLVAHDGGTDAGGDSGTDAGGDSGSDAGLEAGTYLVYDKVTQLTWWPEPVPVSGSFNPATACDAKNGIPKGYQVPTRIQLVSLIDFTQVPTISSAVFPHVKGAYFWTSSETHIPNATSAYWTVDFSSGVTSFTVQGADVLCVKGP